MAGTTENLSKLVSYAVLSNTSESLSKTIAYAIVTPSAEVTSKLVSYAILTHDAAFLSKTVNYAVLTPNAAFLSKAISYVILTPEFSAALLDTVASSDSLSISTSASTNLADTVASSDHFALEIHYIITLSDVVASSDSWPAGGRGVIGYVEGVVADSFVRESFVSNTSTNALSFGKISRSTILSAGQTTSTKVVFDKIVREVLMSLLPGTGPIPVFPLLPVGFPVKVDVVMDTTIGTTKSLRETRVAQQLFPLWDIEIPFQELRDKTQNTSPYEPFVYPTSYQEYEALVQTWLMMYGQTNVFAFDCPWDDSRSNQFIGVGDGSTYTFLIYRTWGIDAQATLAPVGMVNTITSVWVNGVLIPSAHYNITRNKINFVDSEGNTYPPGDGLDITMTFSYYYLCRFVSDDQDFEEFAKNRWVVPSLKFRAVFWP